MSVQDEDVTSIPLQELDSDVENNAQCVVSKKECNDKRLCWRFIVTGVVSLATLGAGLGGIFVYGEIINSSSIFATMIGANLTYWLKPVKMYDTENK